MKNVLVIFFILVIFCTLLTPSCSGKNPVEQTAKLPPGFEQFKVPGVSLDGVFYIAQETPLLNTIDQCSFCLFPTGSSQSIWLDVGFRSSLEAASASKLVPVFDKIWKRNLEESLIIVYPNDQSSGPLIMAAEQNNFVSIKYNFVDQWNLINTLPIDPPGKTVGAGFVKISESLKQWIASIYSNEQLLTEMFDALGKVKIEMLALGLYAQSDLNLIRNWDYKNWGLSLLLVGDSAYPGFVLSVLSNFLPSMGLQGETFNGESIYSMKRGNFYIMLKNAGSLVYVAVAMNHTECGKLLTSALVKQSTSNNP